MVTTPASALGLTATQTQWLQNTQNNTAQQMLLFQFIHFLDQNRWSFEAKELVTYIIEIKIIDKDVNPLVRADCRSFEFAQPLGALQKGCAVKNFNHTFYTAGVRPNGSPYVGSIDSNVDVAYFTMPAGMTNARAANLTARAVTAATEATDLYFFENPDISEYSLGQFFKNRINQALRLVGGSISTSTPPFPIRNPAPYITSVFGVSNAFDCE